MSPFQTNAICLPSALQRIQCATKAYYRLDETSASSNARDSSRSNYDLTKNNDPGTGTGLILGARDFNTSQWFSRGHESIFSIQQGYTIWGWMKPSPSTGPSASFCLAAKSNVVSSMATLGSEWYLAAYKGGGSSIWGINFIIWSSQGTGGYAYMSAGCGTNHTLSDGNWHFFSAWCDGSTAYLTVDDNTPVSQNIVYPVATPNVAQDFGLGASANGSVGVFGLMDEWGIANRVLTDSERGLLYASGAGERVM